MDNELILFDYNDDDINSILEYSNKIIGKRFDYIINAYNQTPYKTYENFHNKIKTNGSYMEISSKSKGQYGNYIERYFFGYQPNNNSESDFPKVGLEIKVTPFKVNKNKTISAKERLVLTILDYMTENLDDFYQTHLWKKCSKILMLFYNGLIPETTVNDYIIEKIFLFDWFKEDMGTILEDYKVITNKIKQGKAHELSESDGNYLSTCTKGAGKGKDIRNQPFSNKKAKQRAWELKPSYMTTIINRILNTQEYESILKNNEGQNKSFNQIIKDKILYYKGISAADLYNKFNISYNVKNKNNLLIKSILGINGDIDKTKEFQQANMNLRVIRVDNNGMPKEDSPFKNYSFKELAENDIWEESHPYLEICSKRFCFVIFKEYHKNEYILDDVKFWGFPERKIKEVKRVWKETRDILNNGVKLTQTSNGVKTNFPQSKINTTIYTKIHASQSLYELENGKFIGNGKISCTDILPDGRHITKHSFWLPKKFLKEILEGKWD